MAKKTARYGQLHDFIRDIEQAATATRNEVNSAELGADDLRTDFLLAALEQAELIQHEATILMRRLAEHCRASGATWDQIGSAAGQISKQAAAKKWGL